MFKEFKDAILSAAKESGACQAEYWKALGSSNKANNDAGNQVEKLKNLITDFIVLYENINSSSTKELLDMVDKGEPNKDIIKKFREIREKTENKVTDEFDRTIVELFAKLFVK